MCQPDDDISEILKMCAAHQQNQVSCDNRKRNACVKPVRLSHYVEFC